MTKGNGKRVLRRLCAVVLTAATLLTVAGNLTGCILVGNIISTRYMKFGAFTVSVNKIDGMNYALTLAEEPEFANPTSRLNADMAEEIIPIDGATLPAGLENVDGEHNGENYVAYTFYCKNMGQKTVTYSYEMYIANMESEVEKAVRVRLYVDEFTGDGDDIHYADYAWPRTDGGTGPEPGTVAFQNGTTIVKKSIEHFAPGDITQYTVVIWLEGPDPECVNKIIGGEFKMDMLIEVTRDETEDIAVEHGIPARS